MRMILVGVAAFAIGLLVGAMLFPGIAGEPAAEGAGGSPAPDPADSDRRKSWESLPPANPTPREFADITRSEIVDRLRALYRRESGENYPADLLRKSAGESHRLFEQFPDGMLIGMVREDLEFQRAREATGVIEDPVDILLQARDAVHSLDLTPVSALDEAVRKLLVEEPLDTRTPMVVGGDTAAFVRGGMIPRDRSLVITRIQMALNLGYDDREGRRLGSGDAEVKLGTTELFKVRGHRGILGATLEGSRRIEAGRESDLLLWISGGCASVRFQGHLVPATDRTESAAIPFAWVPEESEGFMDGKRVVVELLAGRSRALVHFGGRGNLNVDRIHGAKLLHSSISADKTKGSAAYIEGLGPLPPGMVWKLTRIQVSTDFSRRDARKSRFEIDTPLVGEPLVLLTGERGHTPKGYWRGTLFLREKDLSRLRVELRGTGAVRATFDGTLVPDPGD